MSVICVASSALYLLIMKTLLYSKISSFDQKNTSLKTFSFLANRLDLKKKKKNRKGFHRFIYINDYVCLLKIFFISYKLSGQCSDVMHFVWFYFISIDFQESWCLKSWVGSTFCHFYKNLSPAWVSGSASRQVYLSRNFSLLEFLWINFYTWIRKNLVCQGWHSLLLGLRYVPNPWQSKTVFDDFISTEQRRLSFLSVKL